MRCFLARPTQRWVLLLTMTVVFVAGIVAGAQAGPGDVAAHQSNQAAKRKFAKVTPDTWKHVEGKCRWSTGWTYWHCTSRVDGEHGYHGTFRVLVNRATLKAYVRGFVVTAATQAVAAHRISYADARSRWYYVFNDHCGNGTLWVCRDRNLSGSGSCCFPVTTADAHSYYISYYFKEEYVPTGNQRECTVSGKLTHSTVAYWSESCSG